MEPSSHSLHQIGVIRAERKHALTDLDACVCLTNPEAFQGMLSGIFQRKACRRHPYHILGIKVKLKPRTANLPDYRLRCVLIASQSSCSVCGPLRGWNP